VPGIGNHSFQSSAPATVSVDATAASLAIPGGSFGGLSAVVPVSSNTSVVSLTLVNLDLLGGTLRPNGVATQVPGEICPPGGPPLGMGNACDVGGPLGGTVGMMGTRNVSIIPNVIVVPVPLVPHVGVGGSTNLPLGGLLDGAAWTLGRAILATPAGRVETSEPDVTCELGATVTGTLDTVGQRFSMVSPTYIAMPNAPRPWRLTVDFLDGLGVPQFIIDAFDEDGDGLVRSADNCPTLANPGQEDNDGDGLLDAPADPGCRDAAWETESPQCNDGVNNDSSQDTLIDFDGSAAAGLPPASQTAPDPQCQGDGWRLTEWQEPGCGLGGEVAWPLLGLLALRLRWRRGAVAGR